MCGMKNVFFKLDKEHTSNITFDYLSQRPVKGRGKVFIELKNSEQKFISEVYYVPYINNNILNL